MNYSSPYNELSPVEEARRLFEWEQYEKAVDREIAILRAKTAHRSIWRRFLDRLPFTITWKK